MASIGSALAAHNGFGYLVIHAIQFGAQPLLSKRCVAFGTPTESLVLGAEVAKVIGCLGLLKAEGRFHEALKGWTFGGFLLAAGIPSLTYLIQNYCVQVAYQNLDGIVFNILNQTKMLFTAFFVYLIVGRQQSPIQCIALCLLAAAGVLVSLSGQNSLENGLAGNYFLGSCCIVLASALSGVNGAITEWILQRKKRDSYLFTSEMAVIGCAVIVIGRFVQYFLVTDLTRHEGLFDRWTPMTLIPILTQGWGGIVVGLISKFAGSVRKGFAVMVGLLFSCVLKCLVEGDSLSHATYVAVPLVAVSIFLHASYPPKVSTKKVS